jgi:YVTN family beta-propeller protein
MKFIKMCNVLAVMFCVYAQAQWLETTIPVGNEPVDLVYNPTNNKIYCANEHSDDITVIDGASNAVITNVYIYCDGPHALAYNENDNMIYCANRYSDNVSMIDGVSNVWYGNIEVGYDPMALAYSSTSNKIYCINTSSNSISVIDCNTNHVITTIANVFSPFDLVYNSSTNRIYCCQAGGITVISCETDSIIANVSLEPFGMGIGINETNNKYYYGWAGYGRRSGIAVLDGEGDTIRVCHGGIVAGGIIHNPVNNQIYVSDFRYGGSVTSIDGITDSVIVTIAVDDGARALICDQNNNKLYVANASVNNVSVIDCESNTVCATINVEENPCAFAWNPVQNRVYVANTLSASVSVIRDVVGITENQPTPTMNSYTLPTMINGQIAIPEGKNYCILDITGRQVHSLDPAPGIYFIQVDDKIVQKVIKIK